MVEKIVLIAFFGAWLLFSLVGAFTYAREMKHEQTEVRRDIPKKAIEEVKTESITKDITNLHIDVPLDADIQDIVYREAEANGIDAWLVFAVIEQESNFDADAVSKTGDYGLMQINKINHAWLKEAIGFDDILDAEDNIRCGCFMLGQLAEKYETESEVLMAYNLGEGGARKLWNRGITESTYSRLILAKREALMLRNLD